MGRSYILFNINYMYYSFMQVGDYMLLGIGIPYYKNSEECETAFKKMLKTVWRQVTEETRFVVYEDGQVSDWLKEYSKGRTYIWSCPINNGVQLY